MPWLNVLLLLYALLDIVMGVLGYVNKGSLPSLLGGVVSGMVILASLALTKTNPRAGRIMALVVAVLLMGMFAKNTFFQNQLYPGGIMFVTSLIVAVCLGVGHMMGMKAKKARAAAETKASK